MLKYVILLLAICGVAFADLDLDVLTTKKATLDSAIKVYDASTNAKDKEAAHAVRRKAHLDFVGYIRAEAKLIGTAEKLVAARKAILSVWDNEERVALYLLGPSTVSMEIKIKKFDEWLGAKVKNGTFTDPSVMYWGMKKGIFSKKGVLGVIRKLYNQYPNNPAARTKIVRAVSARFGGKDRLEVLAAMFDGFKTFGDCKTAFQTVRGMNSYVQTIVRCYADNPTEMKAAFAPIRKTLASELMGENAAEAQILLTQLLTAIDALAAR